MITSTPATKQQRLAALEAGAWDYLSLVINSEELALKLDAFVRVKRSEEHTSELQSRLHLVCRLLLEKKKTIISAPSWCLIILWSQSRSTSAPFAAARR